MSMLTVSYMLSVIYEWIKIHRTDLDDQAGDVNQEQSRGVS